MTAMQSSWEVKLLFRHYWSRCGSHFTVWQGHLKCKKNPFQSFWRALQECPLWELQNEPPFDMSGLTLQFPFKAIHTPDLMQRLAIKGNSGVSPDVSSGCSFQSFQCACSRGSLKNHWAFFSISISPAGLWLRLSHGKAYCEALGVGVLSILW